MDIRFQKLLIKNSLQVAEDSKNPSIKDSFLAQAARQQAALDEHLYSLKSEKLEINYDKKGRLGSNRGRRHATSKARKRSL